MGLMYEMEFGAGTVKVQGQNAKDLFVALGVFSEAPCQCGKCESNNLVPSHRTAQPKEGPNAGKIFHYFQLKCRDCGAQFDFGQRQDDGELFPKYSSDRAANIGGWYLQSEQGQGGGGGYDQGGGGGYQQQAPPQQQQRQQAPPQGGGYQQRQAPPQGGQGGYQQPQGGGYQQGGYQQRQAPPQGGGYGPPPGHDPAPEDDIPF